MNNIENINPVDKPKTQSDIAINFLIGSFIISLLSYIFPDESIFKKIVVIPFFVMILLSPIIFFGKANIVQAIKNGLNFIFFIVIIPIILFALIIQVSGIPNSPEYVMGYLIQTFYYTGIIPIILGILGYIYFMKRKK